ncbi:hypothetical protein SEA_NANOSMITE_79 [Mycobacterium phage Nanosmite]|nr:hypothetical protein SEA_NANOSMITE_79 [Mycobacterium phage Nanosmite]
MAKAPCDGGGRKANPYMKDKATCPVCGKPDVRIVNYRPKIGGRLADHARS